MQGASQASTQGQTGNYAVGNSLLKPVQMMPRAIPPGLAGQHNANIQDVIGRFKFPLTSQRLQQGKLDVCSDRNHHDNPVVVELLSKLLRCQNDAVQRATKESKKRKKRKLTMSCHSSATTSSGSVSRSKNLFKSEGSSSSTDPPTIEARVCESSSSNSCSDEEKGSDNKESFSSSDPTTSDAAKEGETSSSNSCSDEEKGSRCEGPSRKHLKTFHNSAGITVRALQDHDERMARDTNTDLLDQSRTKNSSR